MSKNQTIEALIEATEEQQKLEVKKLEVKLVEAKEQREHKWIYLIWSVGVVLIAVVYMVVSNFWRFVR